MTSEHIPLPATQQYNRLLLDYVAGHEALRPFYGAPPTLAGLGTQLKAKQTFPLEQRQRLHTVLLAQYGETLSPPVQANIDALLDPNTFVITTAHQLNICTGPLYVPFKIMTALALVRILRAAYRKHRFVPVFWMHTEDHDVAEINHLYLNRRRYEADLPLGGAVGDLSAGPVAALLQTLPLCPPLFQQAYTQQPTLSAATRTLLHGLFGEAGLLVLDPMDAHLKKSVLPLLAQDISGEAASAFSTRSAALKALGYKQQLPARSLHFFYLQPRLRGALQRHGRGFSVQGSDVFFADEDALWQAAQKHPERFSPSAALRPLYQETVLPSIAYVGGPAEIAYWLQLGQLFDNAQLPMPVLFPRFFGALIPADKQRGCKKLGLQWADFFLPPKQLHTQLLPALAAHSFADEQAQIARAFASVETQIAARYPALRDYAKRQGREATRPLQAVRDKLRKHLLLREHQRHKSLMALEAFLRPEGLPQERYMNLISFLVCAPMCLSQLSATIDPFDFRFHFAHLRHA